MDFRPALTYLRQGGAAYLSNNELVSMQKNIEAILKARSFTLFILGCNLTFYKEFDSTLTFKDWIIIHLKEMIEKSRSSNGNFSSTDALEFFLKTEYAFIRNSTTRTPVSVDSIPEGNNTLYFVSIEEQEKQTIKWWNKKNKKKHKVDIKFPVDMQQ